MKKVMRITCLLLAGLMILLSVSCKKKDTQKPDDGTGTGAAAPAGSYAETGTTGTGDRHVVSGNKFRIVYGQGDDKDSINGAAILLYNLVLEKTGKRMDLKSDTNNAVQDFEILIGDTNREGNVNTDALTYYDYGWSFDGKKIRIYGGSEEAQENAVKRFVEKYFDEANKGLVVATGEDFRATYSYPYDSISLGGVDVKEFSVAGKFGYNDAAKAVAAGFGRLCGVKLNVLFGKDGAEKPTGNYIYVGYDETEDLTMTYAFGDGVLRFIGNGLLGTFNQLERAVELFFKKNFTEADGRNLNLETVMVEAVMPVLNNMQFADDDFIASLDKRFEASKQAILESDSDYKVTGNGKTYYVSITDGDDSNDGLSPQTPWKTVGKVNNTEVPDGSAILFKRGDVWNRAGRLYSKSNVTFSAYGEGAKPQFSWYIDASLASDWTAVGENLYVYSGSYVSADPKDYNGNLVLDQYPKLDLPGSYVTSTDYDGDDVGNIIFNDDEGWGVKVMKKNASDFSVDLGTVPTGFGMLTHEARAFADQKDLNQHLEFYHNPEESRLYLYCEGGNPAEVFTNIKLVLKEYLFFGGTASICRNTVVDNLSFKYAGCHGISINYAVDFTIQNCEIGWMGGSIQGYTWGGRDEPTRFGEGIQNWGNCKNFSIVNNYLYQVYDGAASSQQAGDPSLKECIVDGVEVTGNCFERNTASIEFWMDLNGEAGQGNNPNFMMKNWNIADNMIRDTGYGFGGTRPKDGQGGAVHFTDSQCWPKPMYEDVLFTGNSSWRSKDGIVSGLGWRTDMYNLEGNVFVHEYDAFLGTLARDFDHKALWDVKTYYYDDATIGMLTEKEVFGINLFYYTYNKNK